MELDPFNYFGRVVCFEQRGNWLVTETAYEAGMSLPRHSHRTAHLAVLTQGCYFERTAGHAHICLPGEAVTYAQDVQHVNWFGDKPGFCVNLEMRVQDAAPDYGGARSMVPAEVNLLLGGHGLSRPLQQWLERARELLTSTPALGLKGLAERVSVHPSHLSRAFRRAYGCSVGEFRTLQRIRGAAKRVIDSEDSLAEIAFDCGFYDQSHLTNEFHKVTGFTPGGLRRIAHG